MLTERGDSVSFRSDAAASPAVGAYVTVRARAEAVHVYDRTSGARLGNAMTAGVVEVAR